VRSTSHCINYCVYVCCAVPADWSDKQHLQRSQFWQLWLWVRFWNQRGHCALLCCCLTSFGLLFCAFNLQSLCLCVCNFLCFYHVEVCCTFCVLQLFVEKGNMYLSCYTQIRIHESPTTDPAYNMQKSNWGTTELLEVCNAGVKTFLFLHQLLD